MRIFKIKKPGSDVIGEFTAQSPEEVYQIHNDLGMQVEIVGEIEAPPHTPQAAIRPPNPNLHQNPDLANLMVNHQQAQQINQEADNYATSILAAVNTPPPPSIPTPTPKEPVFFEVEGKKCKMVDGEVFTKDWESVNMDEYRIVKDSSKAIKGRCRMEDYIVQKLNWIKINKEEINN